MRHRINPFLIQDKIKQLLTMSKSLYVTKIMSDCKGRQKKNF